MVAPTSSPPSSQFDSRTAIQNWLGQLQHQPGDTAGANSSTLYPPGSNVKASHNLRSTDSDESSELSDPTQIFKEFDMIVEQGSAELAQRFFSSMMGDPEKKQNFEDILFMKDAGGGDSMFLQVASILEAYSELIKPSRGGKGRYKPKPNHFEAQYLSIHSYDSRGFPRDPSSLTERKTLFDHFAEIWKHLPIKEPQLVFDPREDLL
ncbi:hypothetical protein TWF481_002679 [Arthrobotrys musiformis]|uniref:Uncharacterized protein n=1 Tax=Arthrobotrys musiformis TaxID=47236 RepID=A0AAV9VQX5_9PEZI